MESGEGRKYEVWVDRELEGVEEGICAMALGNRRRVLA